MIFTYERNQDKQQFLLVDKDKVVQYDDCQSLVNDVVIEDVYNAEKNLPYFLLNFSHYFDYENKFLIDTYNQLMNIKEHYSDEENSLVENILWLISDYITHTKLHLDVFLDKLRDCIDFTKKRNTYSFIVYSEDRVLPISKSYTEDYLDDYNFDEDFVYDNNSIGNFIEGIAYKEYRQSIAKNLSKLDIKIPIRFITEFFDFQSDKDYVDLTDEFYEFLDTEIKKFDFATQCRILFYSK